ncbi:MAG: hypothetical protein ACYDC9_04380 [Dermatophilaceae bacterium]
MSDQLTRLLTETLHSREADVEPMSDLTARVLQKGRSARNRRRVLGWGATVVAAVLAVAAAILGPAGQHSPNPGPANSGMPSPSATSPATVTKTATGDPLLTYALKLPLGPPIAVIPRAEKRGTTVVVVTADHVVTLPVDTVMAFDLTSSAEGLLVTTHAYGFTGGGPDPDQALYLIRPDGRLTTLHKGPFDGLAVDPTGKQFAIAESAGIGAPMGTPVRITIGSLSAPGTTASHTEPSASTSLVGWTTQGLLMSDDSRTWLWKPGGSSTTEIPDVNHASVMPTDPGRLVIATGQPGAGFCLHLYTLSSRQVGPELTCGPGTDWTVSPDGRHAVVGSTVVDLATGRVGPELMDKLGISFAHWEDSTHVLTHIFEAEPQGQPAAPVWVRCDVATGACERAPIKGSKNTSAVIDW